MVDKEGVLHVDKKTKTHERVEIKSETGTIVEAKNDNEEENGDPKKTETDEEFMVFKMTTGYEVAYSKAALPI